MRNPAFFDVEAPASALPPTYLTGRVMAPAARVGARRHSNPKSRARDSRRALGKRSWIPKLPDPRGRTKNLPPETPHAAQGGEQGPPDCSAEGAKRTQRSNIYQSRLALACARSGSKCEYGRLGRLVARLSRRKDSPSACARSPPPRPLQARKRWSRAPYLVAARGMGGATLMRRRETTGRC